MEVEKCCYCNDIIEVNKVPSTTCSSCGKTFCAYLGEPQGCFLSHRIKHKCKGHAQTILTPEKEMRLVDD